jgi:hypothetical protein
VYEPSRDLINYISGRLDTWVPKHFIRKLLIESAEPHEPWEPGSIAEKIVQLEREYEPRGRRPGIVSHSTPGLRPWLDDYKD